MQEFRSKRNEQSKSERVKQAREWRQNSQNRKKVHNAKNKKKQEDILQSNEEEMANDKRTEHVHPSADINFNKFDLSDLEGNQHQKSHHNSRRKLTKQQMLKLAEARQMSLKENGVDSREGRQLMMKSALARARGEKVFDDPALLRRSLKRDNKLKERSAKKWDERLSSQKEASDHKQSKRSENLKRRTGTSS